MITQDQLFQYLEKKIPNFVKTRKAKTGELLFTCPNSANHKFKSAPSATFTPSGNIACLICGFKGTMYDAIRIVEEDKTNKTDAEITDYLISILDLDMYKELNIYQNYEWELLPIEINSKIPIAGESWKENHYKDKIQWIRWLNNGKNLALKTGKINNITGIDVDLKVAPTEKDEEIYKLLTTLDTLIQDTPHGKHFIIQYDEEIHQTAKLGRKQNIKTSVDIRNDGGYILIAPSKIDNLTYKWKNLGTEIKPIIPELKSKILELLKRNEENINNVEQESIQAEELKQIEKGSRNDTLASVLGWFIKIYPNIDPKPFAFYWNKTLNTPPLSDAEILATVNSIASYKKDDKESQKKIIYEYMKQMQTDITAKDIMESLRVPRSVADNALSDFVKEGKAVRLGRGRFQYKEKIEWSDATPEEIKEYDYKVPLFNDVMIFQSGDVLLLGGWRNEGKTTIALNMLKEIIESSKGKVKPYYIYSEAGSRFQKISQQLGITGKYYHTFHENPLAIELEYNSFTIIDWLHLENKAETDTVLKKLNDELRRKGGILVIFTQLKEDHSWFAPNLIEHYPTFAARLIQDNEAKTESHFDIQKIKEPRGNYTTYILPCTYNHEIKIYKKKDINE